jgi:transposase
MVDFPGLSESLGAVGKRISRFDITETGLSVEAASSVRRAVCPTCSRPSSRRHGQYRRRLRAHPCMGRSVILHVQVRRFKCLNPHCPRITFVEPIESLALTKQRGTVGFRGASCAIAQALGGSAGARLLAKPGMPNNRDTLLRALRRLGSEVTMVPPAVVGIDDWAITRGHRYGTIVVDLERRCPIEVLDGRESTSVADWLQRHPLIQVIARDRAGAYSDAAETAIPSAQQVADRWHLLVNLRETVERLLRRHTPKLREAAQLADVSQLSQTQPVQEEVAFPLMAWRKLSMERRAARLARYEEVVRLRAQGEVPKRADHRQFVDALSAIEPEIADASSLIREFLGLIHRRDVNGFDRWLARAQESKASELRRFAGSLTSDLSAVRAAFESPWSSGQVEGQINRLKFLKRQMYGRANVDPLRARVLHPN